MKPSRFYLRRFVALVLATASITSVASAWPEALEYVQVFDTTVGYANAVAFGSDGTMYISQGFQGDGLCASSSTFLGPCPGGNGILAIDPDSGKVRRVAGLNDGLCSYTGDGGPALLAHFCEPRGMAVDALGNIYVADSRNNAIRRIDSVTGVVTTVPVLWGVFTFNYPTDVALDGKGGLLVANTYNNRIDRIDLSSAIRTRVAGTGNACNPGAPNPGDGRVATEANLCGPGGIALDASGALYIADTYVNRIRRVDPQTGIISTIAGPGEYGRGGDGGAATSASLRMPRSVAVAADGSVYIADTYSGVARRIHPSGLITTLGCAPSGDCQPGQQPAAFKYARHISVDGAGRVFVADSRAHRVYRLGPTGSFQVAAGE